MLPKASEGFMPHGLLVATHRGLVTRPPSLRNDSGFVACGWFNSSSGAVWSQALASDESVNNQWVSVIMPRGMYKHHEL
eukprot:2404222-Pyramimonas_sp.AAC.1